MFVHRSHDIFVGMGAGHGKYGGVGGAHLVFFYTQAAGDNDAPVLLKCFTDGFEGFLYSGIDKAAGIHYDQIRTLIRGGEGITLSPQLGENAFRINQCLGATQADKTNTRGVGHHKRKAVERLILKRVVKTYCGQLMH